MGKYGDKAGELFLQGYNCSQSVLGAFCEDLALDKDAAMRLASSFGGGMGAMREVCGAASAVFMLAGIRYGYSEPGNYEVKKEHYARIQELAAKFREYNGELVCRELLGALANKSVPEKRTAEYYKKRPCRNIIMRAADIFGEYMERNG